MDKMKIGAVIFIVFIVGAYTFFPVLNLALFGDDWLALSRFLYVLGPNSSGNYNFITYFLTPYGSQDIFMGLLYPIFGYEPNYYHGVSFTLRFLCAVSLWPLTFYLTKSRLSSFFAMLLFSVTTIGLDTTNWVFNMPSYLALTFFNLFLYFYIKSKDTGKIKLLLLSGLLFYISYILAPIRMPGALPFIFILELYWFFNDRNISSLKRLLSRVSLILFIFIFATLTGESGGSFNDWWLKIIDGFETRRVMLSHGNWEILFYPIVTIGSMLIPDVFLADTPPITSTLNFLYKILAPSFAIFAAVIVLIKNNASNLKFDFVKYTAIAGSCWSVLILIICKSKNPALAQSDKLILLLTGGFGLIIIVSLIYYYLSKKAVATGFFTAITWAFFSFSTAWWWVPSLIFPTTHRYMIGSGIGIAIFVAILINLGDNLKKRLYLSGLVLIMVVIHLTSTNTYIASLEDLHGKEVSNRILSGIPFNPRIGNTDKPLVYYFESENPSVLHNVVSFGFPYRTSLMYELYDYYKAPVLMDSIQELQSAVADGQAFARFGFPRERIPVDNIYAYKITKDFSVEDITDKVRTQLNNMLE